jgi:hypothetical protein
MKMKFMTCVVLFIFTISMACSAENVFTYDADKMDVGSMYSYSIQEYGGTKKMNFYVYVKDSKTIDSYVDFSTVVPQVFIVEGILNTDVCSFERTDGYNPFSYMKVAYSSDKTIIVYNAKKEIADITLTRYDNSRKMITRILRKKLAMFPCYEMSLYQLDFWFAMRFYNGDYSSFKVGSFFNGGTSVSEVLYKGEELVNGVRCDKWEIAQEGVISKLSNQKQIIWFNKEDTYYSVVKYINMTNVNPVGKLDINIINKRKMTLYEWKSFIEEKNEEARIRLGFSKEK